MPIYAHRGVSAQLPENTLAAFARAVELGIAGIELDVQLSADNVPVVIHDDTADRTTNGTGSVSEFTARELGLLDAGAGQFVPTLEQVLRLAAGRLRVNIELKDAKSVAPVAEVVTGVQDLDWFASSADWDALAELCRLVPGADVYPLCVGSVEKMPELTVEGADKAGFAGRDIGSAVDFALSIGGGGISIWEGGLDRGDFEYIHAAGLDAWVWTINDPCRAQELLDLGADGICTDDPELLRGLRQAAPKAPAAAAKAGS